MTDEKKEIGRNVGRDNLLELNKFLTDLIKETIPVRTIERSYNNGVRIYGEGDGEEISKPNPFSRGLETTIDFTAKAFLRDRDEVTTSINSTNPIPKETQNLLEKRSQEAYKELKEITPDLRKAVFEIKLNGKNYSVIMSEGPTTQTKKKAKIGTSIGLLLGLYTGIVGYSIHATKQALRNPFKEMQGIAKILTDNPSDSYFEGKKVVITNPKIKKQLANIISEKNNILKKIGAEAALNIRGNYGNTTDALGMRKDSYDVEINVKPELNPIEATKIIYNAHLNK